MDIYLGPNRGWVTCAVIPGEEAHTAVDLLLEGAQYVDADLAKPFVHQYTE
jgi:hypothetical protein